MFRLVTETMIILKEKLTEKEAKQKTRLTKRPRTTPIKEEPKKKRQKKDISEISAPLVPSIKVAKMGQLYFGKNSN